MMGHKNLQDKNVLHRLRIVTKYLYMYMFIIYSSLVDVAFTTQGGSTPDFTLAPAQFNFILLSTDNYSCWLVCSFVLGYI